MRFRDRREAGGRLAQALVSLSAERPVILALPRGGVPVAVEVARALHAPLDVILVRKIGMPGRPEFGLGAIGENDARFFDEQRVHRLGVSDVELRQVEAAERIELDRRRDRYRGNNDPIDLTGRVAIIVDDGIATGGTVRAAIQAARARGAARVVVAAPVAAPETVVDLPRVADAVVTLDGSLVVPNECLGLVVFAHGSGSSRYSPRNRAVAAALQRAGLGTLLFDLLIDHEAEARSRVVGGADTEVLALNSEAATHLRGVHQIAVVRGATHLFKEPGALEASTRLATAWFVDYLTAAPAMRSLAS